MSRFVFGRLGRRLLAEGGADGFEGLFFVGVGQKAVGADFLEAGRQDVQAEAADEFKGAEGDAVPFVLFAVFGAEDDLAAADVLDAV